VTETPERNAVYRIRGEADLLLYIGVTNSVRIRWNGHQAVQPWWDELRSLTFEWYETREAAEAAEKAAILAEQPKYNVTYLRPIRGKGVQGNASPGFQAVERGIAVIEPQDDDDDLLSKLDVARMARMSPSEIGSVLKRTEGPAGFMLGTHHLYRRGEIRQWIADMEASQRQPAPSPVETPREEFCKEPRPKRRRLSAVPSAAQDDDALFDRDAVS
jgi:predicted GIY-YIG superfamily endonuclease